MTKPTEAPRAHYTLEFKQEAVRPVDGGRSIAVAARTLGVVDQTSFNSVKGHRQGSSRARTANPIARLRAELVRVMMERDILGKATAYFAKAAK